MTIWEVWQEYRRRIILTAIGVYGSYYIYKRLYPVYRQIKDAWELLKDLEQPKTDRWQKGFSDGMDIAANTLQGYLAEVSTRLVGIYDCERVRSRLRRGRKDPKDMAVWKEFASKSFAQTAASVYSVVGSVLLLHIQMCIVQRYNADTKETRPSSAVFTAFLSTAEHFMMTGIDYISDAVLKRVSEHEIFSKPLSTQVGASETRGILNSFSRVMETEDVITTLFPTESFNTDLSELTSTRDQELYHEMVAETRAIIKSQSFKRIYWESVDAGFTLIQGSVMEQAFPDEEANVQLAKLLKPMKLAFDHVLPETASPPRSGTGRYPGHLVPKMMAQEGVQELCRLIFLPLA